ncbi:MAG TPA: SAM-dependent methyltransferase [Chthoniobacteraceae bacterium]|jgi:SAM-dependent MidA family methyltransferase
MTFRDFMEAALYDPVHGYYTSGRAAIGRKGDFFTNVSVGPLFGKLLTRQFAEMWRSLGSPESWVLIEQGAHGGDFAADVLGELQESEPECFRCVGYRIVEPAGELRRRQAERLNKWEGKVAWSSEVDAMEPAVGVHFSNELFDALPVHRVALREHGWVERYVAAAGTGLEFIDGLLSTPRLMERLSELVAPVDYETEVNLAAVELVASIVSKITRGYLLAIDYGFPRDEYYRCERTAGTLTGYAAHRRQEDLLAAPGEIDLTAHVDFTSLAKAAECAGWELCGYTDQHHLMVGLGSLYFSDEVTLTPEHERELRAFKTLMHPDFMGRSFKALCLGKGIAEAKPLTGFQYARDSRKALGL